MTFRHVLLVPVTCLALLAGSTVRPGGPLEARPAQAEAGWLTLFDGTSLEGWRGYRTPDASGTRWQVVDNLLTLPPKTGQQRSVDIVTTGTFDQFELEFDWRISPGGNSGVKYFVLEDGNSAIGHEYQIIDDEKHSDAKIGGAERQTASLYDVLPPSNRSLKPAGEFNQGRIVVRGMQVEHWLNGTRVLQYELGSPALKAAIADSKFKDVARFGTLQKGHILLQDHNDQVWFRTVRIRRLGST